MHPTRPVATSTATRAPLRMPALLGARAFRQLASVPAWVLIASAVSQLVYLVGPDLPNGDLWRKVGYLGLVLSLVSVASPLALIWLLIRSVRSARRAWSIRACDVVLDHAGMRVVGGPAHGFSSSWATLSPDGVQRTREALRLRGGDHPSQWLAIPWPDDAAERASIEALADTLEARVARFIEVPAAVEPPDTPHCTSCGAPLRPSTEPAVVCGHCGVCNSLSPVLVDKVRATASIAERRRRDAQLAASLLRQPSAHTANIVAFSLGALMMAATLLTVLLSTAFAFIDGLEAGLPRLQGLPLLTIGVALATQAAGSALLSNRRALRLLTLGFAAAAPRREGEPFGCRQCGGPLPDPGLDRAVATCVYCATPSVLTPDLRARATEIERRARHGDDPWTVLGRNRRRRRLSSALIAASIALAAGGALWLKLEAERGAIEDSARAAQIPFHDERVLPRKGPWRAERGSLDPVVCFPSLTRLELLHTADRVDAVAIGRTSTRWLRDIAGARREERIPASPQLITAAGANVFLLAGGELQRFDGKASIPLAYPVDGDPLIVGLGADRLDTLWLTTRRSRYGHLRIRRHDGRSVSAPLLVDAREPALSPAGDELAFAQKVGDRFQLVVAAYDGAELGSRRQLTRGEGHIAHPTWSPSGRSLVFLTRPVRDSMQFSQYSGRVRLWLVPARGGNAVQLTHGASIELTRPLWTRDGIWFIGETAETPGERCVWRLTLEDNLSR